MFPIAAGTGTRSARPPTPVRRSCCLCQHLVHHVTFDVCCAGVQGLSKINTCCCTLWCPKAAWAPLWWYLTSPKTPTVARRTSKSTPRPSAAKPSKFNYAMTTEATVRLCDGTDVSLIRSIHPPLSRPFLAPCGATAAQCFPGAQDCYAWNSTAGSGTFSWCVGGAVAKRR